MRQRKTSAVGFILQSIFESSVVFCAAAPKTEKTQILNVESKRQFNAATMQYLDQSQTGGGL